MTGSTTNDGGLHYGKVGDFCTQNKPSLVRRTGRNRYLLYLLYLGYLLLFLTRVSTQFELLVVFKGTVCFMWFSGMSCWVSCLTSPVFLTSHVCLVSPVCLMSVCLTSPVSRLPFHVSCIISFVSRLLSV